MKNLIISLFAVFTINIVHVQCQQIRNTYSWTAINNGLTDSNILSLAISGSNIFAGTYGYGIFLSTNEGISWTPVNNGLTNSTDWQSSYIWSLAIQDSNIYAGTYNGVFLSTNNGSYWTALNQKMTGYITSLAISGKYLFALNNGAGVYLSTDNGNNWINFNKGLLGNGYGSALAINDTNIFSGMSNGINDINSGVYLSSIYTNNWTSADHGIANTQITVLATSGINIYAGTQNNGVFLSTDNGNSWEAINKGIEYYDITSIAISDTNIFVGSRSGGVFLSTNNGSSWMLLNNGLTNKQVLTLVANGKNIFAGTSESGVFKCEISDIIASFSGIKETNRDTINYKFYPNPTRDKLIIEVSKPSKETFVTLYDLNGKELLRKQITSSKTELDVSNLLRGIYLLKYTDSKSSEIIKIVKE